MKRPSFLADRFHASRTGSLDPLKSAKTSHLKPKSGCRRRNQAQAERAIADARPACIRRIARTLSMPHSLSDVPNGLPQAEPADTDILLTR